MHSLLYIIQCSSWCVYLFFLFKQKTAYEMRISDWSSDVCSSDLQDFAFHQAIVEATQNPHFIALSSHLEQGARRVIRQARTNTKIRHVGMIEAVQEEHQVIFDAIKAGDPDAAALAAETHLKHAAQRLDMYLKS